MKGLPARAWMMFGWWLLVGLAIYVFYGYRHSVLRTGKPVVTEDLD